MAHLTVDNIELEVPEETTILEAARSVDIYIPKICNHPDLPPFHSLELSDLVYQDDNEFVNEKDTSIESVNGCGLCLVKIEGEEELISSCNTNVKDGMKITTDNNTIKKQRQHNLIRILTTHPHSCLTCDQREGCIPLTDVCPGNVPFEERCCELLGNCEFEKVVDYVGIAPETSRYQFKDLPKLKSDPLFNRDYNLCIACGRCVRVCQQVKSVYALGGVINEGKLIIGSVNGPMLNDAECKFCGSCVEVCPTGALRDKVKPRLRELSEFVPCKAACPGEVDIPLYLKLVSKGENQKAAEVIASKLTFPSVLGKICFHPCEVDCKRNEISEVLTNKSEPLNIRMIKDYAMRNSILPPLENQKMKSGKEVAVIGSGPTGLTAAFFLALKGHKVIVYEKEEKSGGMLRYGIPRYRLPIDILDKDISRILECGVEIKTNTTIGKDKTIESLKDNVDAVFVSTGLSKSKSIPAMGNNLENVKYGIEFLNSVAKNNIDTEYFKSKSVIIIGGGNVAVDAARTTIRLNADKVTLVCLEQKEEMPAYKWEIKETEEEGIQIINGWGISGIEHSTTDKSIYDIKLKKCISVFDNKGSFMPEYDESITDNIYCNEIIVCIGQEADLESLDDEIKQLLLSGGVVKVKKETLETDIKGIFAGGDIVSGPASVIDAVGHGRKAARSIDKYFGGDGSIDFNEDLYNDFNMYIGRDEEFCMLERENVNYIDSETRKFNFNPFELTYEKDTAITEASRCLRCDLRLVLRHNPFPPEKYLKFDLNFINLVPSEEGVIQLLDDKKEVYHIKGCDNMKETLLEKLDNDENAHYFIYESDPMFTKRESELLQQYLQRHGKLPDAGEDLDDLF